MKLSVDQVKTPQDLLAMCRELGTAQLTALNGLLDKVPDSMKAEYQAMRDRMNVLLAKLPPLDQVPAAGEASWALNSFARTIDELFQYADAFRTRLSDMTATLAEKTQALHSLTEQQTAGELVDKATLQAAIDTAVTNANQPLIEQIATMRKEAVALCGLPEAPAGVLSGSAADFTSALDQAKKNLGICQSKGFSLKNQEGTGDGKGAAFIRKNVWLEATAFQGEAQMVDDLAASLKVKIPGNADPMKGGTAAASGEQRPPETAPRKLTIA